MSTAGAEEGEGTGRLQARTQSPRAAVLGRPWSCLQSGRREADESLRSPFCEGAEN